MEPRSLGRYAVALDATWRLSGSSRRFSGTDNWGNELYSVVKRSALVDEGDSCPLINLSSSYSL